MGSILSGMLSTFLSLLVVFQNSYMEKFLLGCFSRQVLTPFFANIDNEVLKRNPRVNNDTRNFFFIFRCDEAAFKFDVVLFSKFYLAWYSESDIK